MLSLPDQLAMIAAGICRSNGAKNVAADMFLPWQTIIELSPDAFAANLKQRFC